MRDHDCVALAFFADMPEGSQVPAEFQVFPAGMVAMEGAEPFLVDDQGMERVLERFGARGIDMVIDYEHQTEAGSCAPAAGWIKRLVNRGKDGLWATVEWTERGRRYLARKEYRYFSPVFLVSKDGRRLVELLRVALTNAPRLNRINPIVAKALSEILDPAESVINNKCVKGRDGMEFIQMTAKQLGLPESAGAEAVSAAIGKLLSEAEGIVACKEVLDAMDLPASAGKSEVVATIHALKQKPDLTAECSELRRKLAERERDELVSAALKEGKITPAQRDWAEKYSLADPEGFRLFVTKAPRIVPLEPSGNFQGRVSDPGLPGPEQDRINRLL
ncbi:MAG: phage protease, partial [Syntrophobacteraceae bacterium]